MTTKRIPITTTRPAGRQLDPAADDWVASRGEAAPEPVTVAPIAKPKPEAERIKRLTIDIPESLHRDIKAQCAMRGTKIADEVRELLMQKYRNT